MSIEALDSPVVWLKNHAGMASAGWRPQLSVILRLIITGPFTYNSVFPENSCTLMAATGLNSTLT